MLCEIANEVPPIANEAVGRPYVELEDQFCSTACASKPPPTAPCPCDHPDCAAAKQTSGEQFLELVFGGELNFPGIQRVFKAAVSTFAAPGRTAITN